MKKIIKKLIVSFCVLGVLYTPVSGYKAEAASYDFRNAGTWATVGYGYTTGGGFVGALQSNLWSTGMYATVGSVDEAFGSGTYNGVRQFQSKYGLGVDGVAGGQVWTKMESFTVNVDLRTRQYSNPNSSTYKTQFYTYADTHNSYVAYRLHNKSTNGVVKYGSVMWSGR